MLENRIEPMSEQEVIDQTIQNAFRPTSSEKELLDRIMAPENVIPPISGWHNTGFSTPLNGDDDYIRLPLIDDTVKPLVIPEFPLSHTNDLRGKNFPYLGYHMRLDINFRKTKVMLSLEFNN